jgi:hypothetical protein
MSRYLRPFEFFRIPRSPGLPLYLNESEDVQDALTTYSGYEKLKEIYRKYDPTRYVALDRLGMADDPTLAVDLMCGGWWVQMAYK